MKINSCQVPKGYSVYNMSLQIKWENWKLMMNQKNVETLRKQVTLNYSFRKPLTLERLHTFWGRLLKCFSICLSLRLWKIRLQKSNIQFSFLWVTLKIKIPHCYRKNDVIS